MTAPKRPETLPEALRSLSRGWALYSEGIERDNDRVLLAIGAERIQQAITVAIELIKKAEKK